MSHLINPKVDIQCLHGTGTVKKAMTDVGLEKNQIDEIVLVVKIQNKIEMHSCIFLKLNLQLWNRKDD